MHYSINCRLIIILLLGFFIHVSCSRLDLEVTSRTYPDSGNNVSLEMIRSMLDHIQNPTKTESANSNYSIEPFILNNSDTVLYIAQYEKGGGWRVLSTDTRVPPVIAESETGHFSLEEGSPAVAVWMAKIANDMAKVRVSTDENLVFSKEDIDNNRKLWGLSPRSLPGEYSDPYGHWEVTSYYVTEVVDSMDHMVAKWDQGYPYNELSPFYVSRPDERAAAGCVAIAGSQLLLYLHNTIGVPSNMYSEGYCSGNTSGFGKVFANPTSTIWSQMSFSYQSYSYSTLPEAILIGYVGDLVEMHYWEAITQYNSWAFPSNLKNNVFNSYNINCSRGSYNESIVKSSLNNQMPVIVSGSNMAIPTDGDIHCFVIDGYRITRRKYTDIKYWVLDDVPPAGYIMPEDQVSVTYSTPDITSIKINWGWASQWGSNPLNDGWYALTGGWTVNHGTIYDYNYNLYMTYGFSVAN